MIHINYFLFYQLKVSFWISFPLVSFHELYAKLAVSLWPMNQLWVVLELFQSVSWIRFLEIRTCQCLQLLLINTQILLFHLYLQELFELTLYIFLLSLSLPFFHHILFNLTWVHIYNTFLHFFLWIRIFWTVNCFYCLFSR